MHEDASVQLGTDEAAWPPRQRSGGGVCTRKAHRCQVVGAEHSHPAAQSVPELASSPGPLRGQGHTSVAC